jgi:hypothetical protein
MTNLEFICALVMIFVVGYQIGVSVTEHRQAMKEIDEMNARLNKEAQ